MAARPLGNRRDSEMSSGTGDTSGDLGVAVCTCPFCSGAVDDPGGAGGIFADFQTTGRRWTDAGNSSGGSTTALGASGGVVAWSLAGAGLLNATGSSQFFSGSTVDLGTFLPFDYQATLRRAFDAWSAVANIEFIQVADGGGNIGVGTSPTIRISGAFIDGPGGIGGRAFFPWTDASAGDIVFESGDPSQWSNEQFFFVLAMHEIGHAIGLNHETITTAIMNPSGIGGLTGLQTDDINGARAIYGSQDFAANNYYMPAGQANLTLIDDAPSNTIHGNASGNVITGNAAANSFRGNGGNDAIDGGGGTDTAIFGGLRSQYTVADLGGGSIRVVGPDGTDTLNSVERIAFDNATLTLVPPRIETYNDTASQYAWSSYSASYNSFNELAYITYNYDDGTHSTTIYDAANAELYSDYLVSYDVAWQVTRIIFNYDDGTHTVASYDVANEYDYRDYLATFDNGWNLTRTIFVNDDGTNMVRFWDPHNQETWVWIQFEYDSNWNLTATHGQNDNGTTFGNPYNGPGEDFALYLYSASVPAPLILDDALHSAETFPGWFGDFEGSDDLGALVSAGNNEQNVGTWPAGDPPVVGGNTELRSDWLLV